MSVSVLLSIYKGSCPIQLEKCYCSIENQEYKNLEIVTVWDGPITKELQKISSLHTNKVVDLKTNHGLGSALNFGLDACSHELIARIDCDDIMLKDRILIQVKYLKENPTVDVIGGFAIERNLFGAIVTKKVPCGRIKNSNFWLKNPIIHPSVMFKKSVVKNAGGYPNLRFTQDFVLWIKLQSLGIEMHNIRCLLIEFSPEGYKARSWKEFRRVLPAYKALFTTQLVPFYKIFAGLMIRMLYYTFVTIWDKIIMRLLNISRLRIESR